MKIGTTFSGIGSPEQALKNLSISHSVEWACDICKFAKQTYLANHECKQFYDDITKIDVDTLSDIDLYVFGFPCQSYSSNGKRLGLEDHRGKLIYYSLEILLKKKPKYFIAENVKGLLTHDGGNTFNIIIDAFQQCGYSVQYKLLNTKEYGIPHNRPRIYIVGVRNDLNDGFDVFQHEFIECPSLDSFLETNIDSKYLLSENSIRHCTTTKFKSDVVCVDPKIAKCIRTSKKTYYKFGEVYRVLTNIEMLRLQGFPEDFKIVVSDTQFNRQMGNTMTVNVVQSILKNIYTHESKTNI
jgi:DNA (cytosine-5)-methyltransferase 1